jgi:hypothetical protein
MAPFPPVSFFLADAASPVRAGSRRWKAPLPLERRCALGGDAAPGAQTAVCYGDYFLAAADFLRRLGRGALAAAAAKITGEHASAEVLRQIRIFLEKHGAFYHPARVALLFDDQTVSLVLNVAVSEPGRRRIDREYRLLGALAARHGQWLPRIFGSGSGRTGRGEAIPMFLGEWFEGFCEFHLTGDGGRTVLWDPQAGARTVSAEQRKDMYRGAARILGDLYDPPTGAGLHPWHHGAGDFVARIEDGAAALRLITVRGYSAALPPAAAAEQMLRQMLAAFLHLSMRTRIDRADGTGDLLWADAAAVEPTLVGFVEALAEKAPIPGYPDSVASLFLELLGAMPAGVIAALAEESVEGFGPETEEAGLARRRLQTHVGELAVAVRGLCSSGVRDFLT